MSFQSSLEALVGAFMIFYIGCVCVGRQDIPLKIVTELRVKALQGTTINWRCPSVFNKNACNSYDPKRYR